MPSSVRLLLGGLVGLVVTWFLATGAGAQQGMPGYPLTMTAQAGGATLTSTPTATGAATATGTAVSSAAAVAANSPTIAGGRGRVANVRDRGFTVLWTTDADAVGQVNFGISATLGSTATDQRGPAFAGRTHFVEVGGLTPNTTYFFDLVSGGVVDNNAGQHYQIRTGPEIASGAPMGNSLLGDVRQPGGVAPAGGALVWVHVRDANSQGTGSASQLLAGLADASGRFQIGLQPRTVDLATYFVYQNEGDLIEASARHEAGAIDNMGLNTAITQGGSTPNNVQIVLNAVSAAAATTTATLTPIGAAATPQATNTPLPTAAPAAVQPPAQPAAGTSPTPVLSVPVQLPALKEMALDQVPGYPGASAPPVVTTAVPAAPGPAYPGAGAPAQPPPVAKPGQVGGAPAPTVATQPPPAQPRPPGALVPTPPPGGAQPGAFPAAPAPTSPVGLPSAQPGVAGFATPPSVGLPSATQPGAVPGPSFKPQGSFGAPSVTTPGAGGTATAPPSAPLAMLANLPPIVSALFYGGILVVAVGGGLAIWSVLNGTGWRPR